MFKEETYPVDLPLLVHQSFPQWQVLGFAGFDNQLADPAAPAHRTHRPLLTRQPCSESLLKSRTWETLALPQAGPAQCPRRIHFPPTLPTSTGHRPTFFHSCVPQEDVLSMAPGQHHSQTMGRTENTSAQQHQGPSNVQPTSLAFSNLESMNVAPGLTSLL